MDIIIHPKRLSGEIRAIPSKSQAHRLLICAAFADAPTSLSCTDTNRDIEATVSCLNALGAAIQRTTEGYRVIPTVSVPRQAILDCGESGSTLRFMLPIVGALGVDATFQMAGRLPQRPLSPLWEEMERMGCAISRPTEATLRCQGQLQSGDFTISGGVSSQFITGLLYAAALLPDSSRIHITGKLESKPYVAMTQQAMTLFGIDTKDFCVSGGQRFRTPGDLTVEGDWSNGAFWLAANALGGNLTVTNLDSGSTQGDRIVGAHLSALDDLAVIDATDTPDLVPVLAIVAGAKKGATFINCGRLRLKETDRLATTVAMINALGGVARIQGDSLIVHGTGYQGGIVDATNDHRIAMSAAVAATVCKESVTILSAHEVSKSYPSFWKDYQMLGGRYEQYIR
ncbi:MAG: 3-phosphoshikimate 1-carboxyvinyltransferase [Oscillospiraceae bacterium]|nr:3-phosphoshikimate 1-carboxyvinyltransferase [Oscillospiraceae bacterium]